jgi:hypothetical protein
MKICLYLDPSRVFRWHLWLAEALVTKPEYEVVAVFSTESQPLPRFCRLLFEIEGLVYGLKRDNALDQASAELKTLIPIVDRVSGNADVVIDLAADGRSPPPCSRILVACFNQVPGEIGAIAALVDSRPLIVEVLDNACIPRPWTARPANADREVFSRGLDGILSCTVRLLVKAVEGVPHFGTSSKDHPIRLEPGASHPLLGTAAAVRATGALTHKIWTRLCDLAKGGRTWAVGWRFTAAGRTLLDQCESRFTLIADQGSDYFADPFPFRQGGRNFIFVEEFSYSAGRGCISAFDLGEQGAPRLLGTVLEEPYHLSYPFVFERAGEIWMIPESGEGRGVYLYRAEEFPLKWKREACLIADIEAYDATLTHHEGRYWLFLCERAWHSSGWDILSLFHSETLTGEWIRHSRNPVTIDKTFSRPAGAIFTRNGVKVRPTQDCSNLYGGAIAVCRIDTLTEGQFHQTSVGRLHAGKFGCHTYNSHGRLEAIDVFGRVRGLKKVDAFFAPVALTSEIERAAGENAKAPAQA